MKLFLYSIGIVSGILLSLNFKSCNDDNIVSSDNRQEIDAMQRQIDSFELVVQEHEMKRTEWMIQANHFMNRIDTLEKQKQTIKHIYHETTDQIIYRSNNAPIDSLVRDMSDILSKSDSLIKRYTSGI